MTSTHTRLLQFRLRNCFWFISGICVILAFVVPRIGRWPETIQFELWCQFAVFLVAFLGVVGCLVALRLRAEYKCGEILIATFHDVPQRYRRAFLFTAALNPIMVLLPLTVRLYYRLSYPELTFAPSGLSKGFFYISPALVGMLAATCVMHLLFSHRLYSVEFGANGYINGLLAFTPWNGIASYELQSNKKGLVLRGKYWRTTLPIDPIDCNNVDAFLADRIALAKAS